MIVVMNSSWIIFGHHFYLNLILGHLSLLALHLLDLIFSNKLWLVIGIQDIVGVKFFFTMFLIFAAKPGHSKDDVWPETRTKDVYKELDHASQPISHI